MKACILVSKDLNVHSTTKCLVTCYQPYVYEQKHYAAYLFLNKYQAFSQNNPHYRVRSVSTGMSGTGTLITKYQPQEKATNRKLMQKNLPSKALPRFHRRVPIMPPTKNHLSPGIFFVRSRLISYMTFMLLNKASSKT